MNSLLVLPVRVLPQLCGRPASHREVGGASQPASFYALKMLPADESNNGPSFSSALKTPPDLTQGGVGDLARYLVVLFLTPLSLFLSD